MSKKILTGVLLCFFSVFDLVAQESGDPAAPSSGEVPEALLRAWIFGSDEPRVTIVLLDEQGGVFAPLADSANGAVSAGETYMTVRPGRRTVELRADENVLARVDVPLRKDGAYTLLAWKNGQRWQTRVFSDSARASESDNCFLRVVNFAGERETLLSVDGSKEVKVPSSTVEELPGPRKVCMVRVQVLAPDGGPPAQSSVELDMSTIDSAYVVVGPDYRGRMRPRVITGGPTPEVSGDAGGVSADAQR